jgi:hypothetical protein
MNLEFDSEVNLEANVKSDIRRFSRIWWIGSRENNIIQLQLEVLKYRTVEKWLVGWLVVILLYCCKTN